MKNRNNHKKYNISSVLVLAFMLCFCAASALSAFAVNAADSGKKASDSVNKQAIANAAVEILKYELKGTVNKDHSYDVVEKISVKLPADTQSLEFVIPSGNFRVSDIKLDNALYMANKSDDANTVKISQLKKLKAGVHNYTIEYKIREFKDRDEQKDMFYFDVLLPSWDLPIDKVDIELSFPSDFPWDDMQYYAGQFGVQDMNNKIDFKASESSKTVKITGERIPENFGITVKDRLPDGYWENALDGIWAVYLSVYAMLALAIILSIFWLIGGRDPKVKKEVQDKPIEGVTPIEVGYIFTGRIHTKDLICFLVYLATKGYLEISEYKPKKYRLIRKNSPEGEQKFIRNAYDILFDDVPEERGIEMEDIGPRMRRMRDLLEDNVAAGFSSRDMVAYTTLSRVLRTIGAALLGIVLGGCYALSFCYLYKDINYAAAIVLGLVAIVNVTIFCKQFDRQYYSATKSYRRNVALAALLYAVVPLIVGVKVVLSTGYYIVAAVILLLSAYCGWMIVIMRARAKGNAELVAKYQQLRKFIEHPTPKEIVRNFEENNNYFYDMVPYTLMFEGMESWGISFLTMKVAQPDWYSDDIEGHAQSNIRTAHSTVDFARDMKAFYRTMIDSYRRMIRRHRKG